MEALSLGRRCHLMYSIWIRLATLSLVVKIDTLSVLHASVAKQDAVSHQ